mmetsp:Transcript_4096/g.8723  ORF Transcript_4096/g.8723 Transcript_4096/m.8723 type:complete len:233 (+) Transcript_4096:953-1651(+)
MVLSVLSNMASWLSGHLLQHVIVHFPTGIILPRCLDTALSVLLLKLLVVLLGFEASVDCSQGGIVTLHSLEWDEQLRLGDWQRLHVSPCIARHVFSCMPPLRHPTRRSLLRRIFDHSLVSTLHCFPMPLLHNSLLNLNLRDSLLLNILGFNRRGIGSQLWPMVQLPSLGARMHRVRPSGPSASIVGLVLHAVARPRPPFTGAVRVVALRAEPHRPLCGPLPARVTRFTSHCT